MKKKKTKKLMLATQQWKSMFGWYQMRTQISRTTEAGNFSHDTRCGKTDSPAMGLPRTQVSFGEEELIRPSDQCHPFQSLSGKAGKMDLNQNQK